MKIEKAKQEQFDRISELLKANDLPNEDIADHFDNFFVVKDENDLYGCVGFEDHDSILLLRSLVVDRENQGKGYGYALTNEIVKKAKEKNAESVYLLTTTAELFFAKYGFKSIDRTDVPEAVKNTTEYKHLCPDFAVVMSFSLSNGH